MKKVIVAGAFGFIGFHLCMRLLEEGVEVVAIDGCSEKDHKDKIDTIGRNALLTRVNSDIENAELSSFMAETDVIYDVIEEAYSFYTRDRMRGILKKLYQRIHTITEAAKQQCPLYVSVSSTEVYGKRSGKTIEASKTTPKTPYGMAALAKETYLLRHCEKAEMPLIILRMPAIYGPWQTKDEPFQHMIVSKLKERPCAFGKRCQDVLYIDDAVEALVSAASLTTTQIINVASGKKAEWDKGKDHICKQKHSAQDSEENLTFYSIEKAKKVLNFQQKMPVQSGINELKKHIIARNRWF